MEKEQVIKLLEKYEHGACNANEKRLVESFLESYQQQDMQWETWKHGKKDVIGARILDKVKQQRISKIKSMHLLRYAAVITILIAAVVMAYHWVNTNQHMENFIAKHTLRGQKSTIVLSDGSTVRLNSESTITYPEQFDKDNRMVRLTGEAFFDVNRDENRPFVIQTGQLTTQVLGTSFNVKAFPEQNIEVTVATGKVRVTTAGEPGSRQKEKVILTPREQAVYDPKNLTLVSREVQLSKILAWKEGKIIFDKVTLREAAQVLERWYNVEIVFENEKTATCIIHSEYHNENLMGILESMEFAMGISYRFDGHNVIYIEGNCN